MAKETEPKTPRRKEKSVQSSLNEKIAKKAYEIYEQRDREPGKELDDWLEAEKVVRGRKKN